MTAQVTPILMYPKQQEFVCSRATIKGFVAGRGSGKTRCGCIDIMWNARDGESYMCVGPDYTVMYESTWVTFIQCAEEYGRFIRKREKFYPECFFRTRDGGTAHATFRSADEPEKLRGPSKAGIWLDEASIMPKAAFDISLPALRHRGQMGQMRMTFTPRGRTHWTFEKFFEECEVEYEGGLWICNQKYRLKKNRCLVRASSRDNPFLAEEYADIVGDELTTDLRRQEIEGEFVDFLGILFSRGDFMFMDPTRIPRAGTRVRYWDIAGTQGAGCYTVGLLMVKTNDNRYIIEDVQRGQWGPAQRYEEMRRVAARDQKQYGGEVMIWVEQEGGSSGKEIAKEHILQLMGYPVFIDKPVSKKYKMTAGEKRPGEGKMLRAIPFAGQVERHNVYLPTGADWTEDYIDELVAFGTVTLCDQVDASSGAFSKLTDKKYDGFSPERIDSELGGLGGRMASIQQTLHRRRMDQ